MHISTIFKLILLKLALLEGWLAMLEMLGETIILLPQKRLNSFFWNFEQIGRLIFVEVCVYVSMFIYLFSTI